MSLAFWQYATNHHSQEYDGTEIISYIRARQRAKGIYSLSLVMYFFNTKFVLEYFQETGFLKERSGGAGKIYIKNGVFSMKFKVLAGVLGLYVMSGHMANAADWSGPYIGGQIGWHGMMLDTTVSDATGTAESITDTNGFGGGVYAGYNFQSGSYLYGLEADINFNNASEDYDFIEGTDVARLNLSQKTTGTIRGRVGYVRNNFLFYGTVGIAFSKMEGNYNIDYNGNQFSGSISESLTGVAFGAGIEHKLSNNMSIRVGMIMTNYENLEFSDGTTNVKIEPMSRDIKVGFSYRF